MKNNKLGLTGKQLNYLLAMDFINRRTNIFAYIPCYDITAQLECSLKSYKILTTKLIHKGLIEKKVKNDRMEYVRFTKIGYQLLTNIFEEYDII